MAEVKASVGSDSPTNQDASGKPVQISSPSLGVKATPLSSVATPTSAVAELSNVPLDSPPPLRYGHISPFGLKNTHHLSPVRAQHPAL